MLAPKEMPGRADFCHGAVDHPLFVLQEILAVPPPCDSSPAELSRALCLVAGGAQSILRRSRVSVWRSVTIFLGESLV